MRRPLLALVVLAAAPAVGLAGGDATARTAAPPDEYREFDVVEVIRREQPPSARTTTFTLGCRRQGYVAVQGTVSPVTEDPDVVVVADHAAPPGWFFELTAYDYGQARLEVLCVKGGTPPPRYHFVVRSVGLAPRETKRVQVDGPRYVAPLELGFRVRSATRAEPPSGRAHVDVLAARPRGRGFEVRLHNGGAVPLRVELRPLLVRTRSGTRSVAATRVVTVARTAAAGGLVDASARCPAGSAPAGSGWSFAGPGVVGEATSAGRVHRFRARNRSRAPRKVRFYGVCLDLRSSPGRPFTLGPSPLEAVGEFANVRGGCRVASSFADRFLLHAPGDGTLTITQPRTGDVVVASVASDGSFGGRSATETYSGTVADGGASATYSYTTADGCVATYDATFAFGG